MKEIVKINHEEYGLEESRAKQIAEAFATPLQEMIPLESEYKNFENLVGEPPKETCIEAKILLKKYVSIRTETARIHKLEKAAYLGAGRFVDAWKNRQLEISKEREQKLKNIAEYHENKLKEQLRILGEKREALAREYLEQDEIPQGLSAMSEDVWEGFFAGIKAKHEEKIAAEKKAEEKRLAMEEAERVEQERVRAENKRLQKEAEERERKAQQERKAHEAELRKKEEAAAAERAKAEALLRKEREEKEALEAEKRAQIAAERAKAEALEKGSDREKLLAYIGDIYKQEPPKVSSPEAKEIIDLLSTSIVTARSRASSL